MAFAPFLQPRAEVVEAAGDVEVDHAVEGVAAPLWTRDIDAVLHPTAVPLAFTDELAEEPEREEVVEVLRFIEQPETHAAPVFLAVLVVLFVEVLVVEVDLERGRPFLLVEVLDQVTHHRHPLVAVLLAEALL